MLTIRRYQSSDHPAVWDLHKTALLAAGAYIHDSPFDVDLGQIEAVYLNNGGEFLVGTIEDRVVAMGALRRTDPDRAEIKRMRVHTDFQRQGFGQAIYTALEKRARELGYSVLHLDTAVVLVGAQHFYTKNGYQEVRRGKLGIVDCIFYEKRIGSDKGH
ncbi:MAG TPA: GNAT family N-acetyltransferase [Verrucomicrobiae bacterium]|nr:GNAT family N-acetyltransferase [Verrucomicrobiae bacterium]